MGNYVTPDEISNLIEQNRQAATELRDALAKRFPAHVWEVKPSGSTKFYVRAKDILVTVYPAHKGLYWAKVQSVKYNMSSVHHASFEDAVLQAREQALAAARALVTRLEA